MKLLLILLLCSVAVGQEPFILSPPSGDVWRVWKSSSNHCFMCDTSKGEHLCTHKDWPYIEQPDECTLQSKPEPMNVPAITAHRITHHKGECWSEGFTEMCTEVDATEDYATCSDESWELHTSVSGKMHWCSRPPVMEKP